MRNYYFNQKFEVPRRISFKLSDLPNQPTRCWTIKQCPFKGHPDIRVVMKCRVKRHFNIPLSTRPHQTAPPQVQPTCCWTLRTSNCSCPNHLLSVPPDTLTPGADHESVSPTHLLLNTQLRCYPTPKSTPITLMPMGHAQECRNSAQPCQTVAIICGSAL